MPAAHVLTALFAVAAVDVELADDWPARDFGLELLVEVVFDDLAAAIGTLLGQRRLVRFVDLARRRRFAMGVRPVLVALFAARLFGLGFGFPLGERGGLPLGRALGFFEALLERANRCLKLRDLVAQVSIFEEQLLVRRCFHADLDSESRVSCRELWRFSSSSASGR
jgi:hypothetical protein